jgi:hypothetical protein
MEIALNKAQRGMGSGEILKELSLKRDPGIKPDSSEVQGPSHALFVKDAPMLGGCTPHVVAHFFGLIVRMRLRELLE